MDCLVIDVKQSEQTRGLFLITLTNTRLPLVRGALTDPSEGGKIIRWKDPARCRSSCIRDIFRLLLFASLFRVNRDPIQRYLYSGDYEGLLTV